MTNIAKTEMQTLFGQMHAQLEHVKFDPAWSNGTGYFDGALEFKFPLGSHAVAFTAPAPDSRKGVICKIQGGTLCLFERYTPDNGSPFVMVANATNNLRKHWPHGQWSTEAVRCLRMMIELI